MSVKLYIVHGWTYNLDKWQTLLPLLTKQGIEPVLLKVPGLTIPSDKVWAIDDYAQWLDEQLAGEKHPIVLGHSNGGRIALYYDNQHPGRLKQLLLLDAAGVPHTQKTSRLKLATLRSLSKIGKPFAHVPAIRKVFYRLVGAQDYYQAPPNMKKTMQQMLAANSQLKFEKISVPTTLIWGADDQQTPLSDGRYMAAHIPSATLHVIDGARHAPMATHAAQVADIVGEVMHR